jgi:trans-aconitate methyltransferase
MDEKTWMNGVWKTNEYETVKKISFELLDSFLTSPPTNILDIGCGLAFESELFQRKYNCNLYLLDGDFELSENATRDRKYGDVQSMAFYSKIPDLIDSFNKRNLRYNFVDANHIDIQKDLKFDLIYSNVSCGFHYPLNTYYDLLKKHTNENSVIIFDINSRYLTEQLEDLFEVVENKNYPGQKKILKCKLKLKNKSGIKNAV